MFAQTRLTELQARKELLLLQAAAHRRLLEWESTHAAGKLHWVETAHHTWQRYKPFAWVAAPVAGFVLARQFRNVRKVWRWITPWL